MFVIPHQANTKLANTNLGRVPPQHQQTKIELCPRLVDVDKGCASFLWWILGVLLPRPCQCLVGSKQHIERSPQVPIDRLKYNPLSIWPPQPTQYLATPAHSATLHTNYNLLKHSSLSLAPSFIALPLSVCRQHTQQKCSVLREERLECCLQGYRA